MDTNDSGLIDGGDPEHLVGSTFADRYTLTRFGSAGANTTIFDADDGDTGRPVTIKVVRPDLAVAATFRDRFDDTMRAVAALSHPNIAAVYDWGTAPFGGGTTVYVVMEQLTAGSLRDMFDRGRRLSPSQALAVGLEVCKGLDHAHRRGFVHTELTPSKLVFGDDRRLRIVDFGLAALLGESVWAEPATVPTHVARYASPEQALSLPVDGTTDVYALCLALVEAVTGTLPFAADSTVSTLAGRVGRLMPVSADLGPLAAVLERAGRPDPEDRSTAAEFGRGLVGAAEKLPRPEPLPLLSTGLFDTPAERLRSPEDPTGGVTRPAPTEELLVVPLDEPGPDVEEPADGVETDAGTDDDGDDPLAGLVIPAVAAGVVGAAGVAAATLDGTPGNGSGDDDLVIVPLDEPDEPGDDPEPDAGAGDPVAPVGGDHVVPDDDSPVDPLSVEASSVPSADVVALAGADAAIVPDAAEPDEPTAPVVAAPEQPPATIDAAATDAGDGRPRRRRRALLYVLFALVVVGALVGLSLLAVALFSTPSHTVPDLRGVEEQAAQAQIADFDWEVTVRNERSDDEPRAGYVIRTNPPKGDKLAEGEPFLLVVSDGPVLRPLPELTGQTFAEAQTRLVELGLEVVPLERYDEVVPAGDVVAWSVPGQPGLVAGSEVEPGTEVQVVVSLGPAPRTVPELLGDPVDDARAQVEELDLVFNELQPAFDDNVPAGAILAQKPDPGEQVERGTTVEVVVSRGPDVVPFPDLAGLTYADASKLLTDTGFVPKLVLGSSQGTFVSASIGGQPAVVGQTYPRGTQVDVIFL